MRTPLEQGATLIELVVAIVIIGMSGATIVGLLASISRYSAETMIQSQSASIANAYLSEILSRSFADPDGAPETGRGNFDDVNDYDGLVDAGAADRYGNAVAGLGDYTVAVVVTQPGLGAIPTAQTRMVRVTVTHPLSTPVMLSGFKTQHP